MSIDNKEFAQAHAEMIKTRHSEAMRCGPTYREDEGNPLVWYNQVFERNITPAGAVACSKALRVGSTQNGLDVVLVACHENTANVVAAAGATITFKFLQSETEDGEYKEVGPSVCLMAPEEGMAAEPCMALCRVALGNFKKPSLKVNVEFAGTISGGNVDCALSHVAR